MQVLMLPYVLAVRITLSGTFAPNSAGVSWTHNGNGTITGGTISTPTYNSVSSDGPTVTLTFNS